VYLRPIFQLTWFHLGIQIPDPRFLPGVWPHINCAWGQVFKTVDLNYFGPCQFSHCDKTLDPCKLHGVRFFTRLERETPLDAIEKGIDSKTWKSFGCLAGTDTKFSFGQSQPCEMSSRPIKKGSSASRETRRRGLQILIPDSHFWLDQSFQPSKSLVHINTGESGFPIPVWGAAKSSVFDFPRKMRKWTILLLVLKSARGGGRWRSEFLLKALRRLHFTPRWQLRFDDS